MSEHQRTITDMVERAARALWRRDELSADDGKWDRIPEMARESWREKARAALEAALAPEAPPARPAPWATTPAGRWDTWDQVPTGMNVNTPCSKATFRKTSPAGAAAVRGVFSGEWRDSPATPDQMDHLAPFTASPDQEDRP